MSPIRAAVPDVRNALCLRADVHLLFDRHMLAIREDNYTVLLAPAALASTYADLQGRRLILPMVVNLQPDREALARHREEAGLG